MRQSAPAGPPPQQCCEVCRAARALQLATDALNTFRALGGTPHTNDPHLIAVKDATVLWDYARGGRHTGLYHAPVVVA
jgi:hypothetical protein